MGSFMRAVALMASVLSVPLPAAAQVAAPDASAGPVVRPPIDGDAPASAKPVVPATGYSFGAPNNQKTPRVERAPAHARHANLASANATMAGFETMGDGSTRLFVDLTKPAPYDAKPGPSSVTYVLKGVRVDVRNNQNPLVTVHFNTPMTSARLVPHGRDLWLIVDLRAPVQPSATMEAASGGSVRLRVDFPKGEFLPLPSGAELGAAPNASGPHAAGAASASAPQVAH